MRVQAPPEIATSNAAVTTRFGLICEPKFFTKASSISGFCVVTNVVSLVALYPAGVRIDITPISFAYWNPSTSEAPMFGVWLPVFRLLPSKSYHWVVVFSHAAFFEAGLGM